MRFPAIVASSQEDRNWWFAARTHALLGIVDRQLAASLPARLARTENSRLVLDVGCGAGNMHHHLLRYGKVYGADVFLKPLRVARQRGHNVTQAGGSSLPFPDGSFDVVMALDVIEHCQDDGAVLSSAPGC